jgi:hypothetical protein
VITVFLLKGMSPQPYAKAVPEENPRKINDQETGMVKITLACKGIKYLKW